jgi:hypothetical protein
MQCWMDDKRGGDANSRGVVQAKCDEKKDERRLGEGEKGVESSPTEGARCGRSPLIEVGDH